ncbi:MAG: carboxymuconolactone decarboxylase family protein [Halobacteriaceae archaeon]
MRVDPVTYDDIEDPELRALFEAFPRNESGEVDLPNHFQVEAHLPEVTKHVLLALQANRENGDLPRPLVRKLYLAVSMANDCGYCTGVYCTILSESVGDDAVREFQRALEAGELAGREGDIVEFAVTLATDPHTLTDAEFESLREHGLTDRDFVQIVSLVNIISGYNRVTTAFDCEYEEFYHAAPWEGL